MTNYGENENIKDENIIKNNYQLEDIHFYTFTIRTSDFDTIIISQACYDAIGLTEYSYIENNNYHISRLKHLNKKITILNENFIKKNIRDLIEEKKVSFEQIVKIKDNDSGVTSNYLCAFYIDSDGDVVCVLHSEGAYAIGKNKEIDLINDLFSGDTKYRNIGIWHIDTVNFPGKIWVNDMAAIIAGIQKKSNNLYTYDEWTSAIKHANIENHEYILENIKSNFASSKSGQEKEYQLINSDGKRQWILDKVLRVKKDNNGVTTQVYGLIIDVSLQSGDAGSIQKINSFFDKTLKFGQIGVWVAFLDDSKKTLWATNNTVNMLGLPKINEEVYSLDLISDLINKAEGQNDLLIDNDDDELKKCLGINKNRFKLNDKNGNRKWYSININYFDYDSDGNAIRCYGILVDITENVLREKEILRLTTLFNESAQSGNVGVWAVDEYEFPGNFWMSDHMASMLGFKRSSNRLYDRRLFYTNLGHSNNMDEYKKINSIIKKAVIGKNDSIDEKIRLTTATGEKKWYILRSHTLIRNDSNIAMKIYGVLLDITEQILYQKELSDLSQQFEQTMEATKVGSWAIDLKVHRGFIWMADNTAEIFGIQPDSSMLYPYKIIYENVDKSNDIEYRKYIYEELSDLLDGKLNKLDERLKLQNINGESKWYEIRSNVSEFNSDGTASKLYGVIIDIDEKIKGEEKLSNISKIQKTLIDISTKYINIDIENENESIEDVLSLIGKSTQADRVDIFRIDKQKDDVYREYRWMSNDFDFYDDEGCIEIVKQNYFNARNSKDIVEEMHVNVSLKKSDIINGNVDKVGNKEILCIPIYVDEKIYGYACFESYKGGIFTEEVLDLLKIFINIYASIMQKINTELSRRESEEKYINLFESSLNSVQIISFDEKDIVDCNDNTVKLFGYNDKSEIIGRNINEFMPKFQDNGILSRTYLSNYVDIAQEEGSAEFDINCKTSDDNIIVAFVKIGVIVYGGQKFFLSSINDITEQMQQQKIIEKSQRHLKITTESANIAPWEWNVKDRKTTSEDIYTKVMGIDVNMAGTDIWEENIHPADIDMVKGYSKRMLDGRLKSYTITYRFYHKIKNEYVWIKDTVIADNRDDYNNKPTTIIGISQDITSQKEIEEEVRLNTERLRLAIQSAQITAWEWNLLSDYGVITSADSNFWGAGADNYGFSGYLLDRVHPDDLADFELAILGVIADDIEMAQVEHRFMPEGQDEYIWVLTAGKIVEYSNANQPLIMSGIMIDIDNRKNSDEEIRNIEKDLANVFNSATNGFIIINAENNRIVNVNPMTVKMFNGDNVDDFLHYKLNDFTPKYQDKHVLSKNVIDDAIGNARENGLYVNEMYFRKFDDTQFYCEAEYTDTVYRNEPAFIISIKDITDRKLAEKRTNIFYKIAEYEIDKIYDFKFYILECAMDLLESLGAGFLEYDENEQRYVMTHVVWNDLYTTNKEYLDAPYPTGLLGAIPDNEAIIVNNLKFKFDFTMYTQNDTKLKEGFIERAILSPMEPEKEHGTILAVINSQQDYTPTDVRYLGLLTDSSWKKVELYDNSKNILASKESAERIIETIPIPLQVFDAVTKEVYISNNAYFEFMCIDDTYEVSYLLNDYVNQEDKVKIETIISNEEDADNVEIYVRKIGSDDYAWVLATYKKIFYLERNCYIVGMFDLSEIKEAQAQQEAAKLEAIKISKIKTEFLANMSHEIRTPINAVIGLNELMQNTNLSPKQLDYTNKLGESAKNLLAIINDVLDVSKLESGRVEMEKTEFDLDNVLSDVFNIVSVKVKKKNIRLRMEKDPDIQGNLIGDPYRLEQVLINLTDNAVKFTDKGEVLLQIDLLENSDIAKIKFSVKDTGIGMTESQVEDLFEAFHQADTSTTRRYGGTGLGLNISQKIVEIMGSEIVVKSEFGKGSEFSFVIDLEKSGNQSQIYNDILDEIKGMKIMIIDDDDSVCDKLCGYFRSLDTQPICVGYCSEAIYEYKREKVDIIIVEKNISCNSGLDFIESIRQLDEFSGRTKFILMEDYQDDTQTDDIDRANIESIITKPFTLKTVIDAIVKTRVCEIDTGKLDTKDDELDDKFESIKGAKILLVEDHEINQQIVKEMLEIEGFFVDVADDGSIALLMLERTNYDLVLMDLQMPKIDGYVASRMIREDLKIDIPIVAVSADVMSGVIDKVMKAGMNDYVAKPIDRVQLFKVMTRWIKSGSRKVNDVNTKSELIISREVLAEVLQDFDVSGGMYRNPENYEIYFNILNKFVETSTGYFIQFDELVKAENIDEAKRNIHSFKGVTGMIGALGLYSDVVEIEKKLKANELENILDMTKDASVILDRIISQIKDFGKLIKDKDVEDDIAIEISMADLKSKIDELYLLLDTGNTNAEDICNDILKYKMDSAIYKKIKNIKKLIENYDFEEARQVCFMVKRSID